ncbi:type II toxin-antitoxin system HipA family toxin [Nocardioides luteus]|uniref:Toxin HipA n=1 Tax=Nocardioides luteus TaxID=1844 RepID=A0A1J4N8J8_9ACTN|nr:HipA domain-containing protein [Nocardioides luteus]OIJ27814.1 toxin HipA [Nocardioides luteus]
MSDLVVELYGEPIGRLAGSTATYDFVASVEAVETYGLDSTVLSLAIPLAPVAPRGRKPRRQNFFAEMLPEGRMLSRLAAMAGVNERDVIGLLRTYGRDVAGALQIWDPDVPGEPRTPKLEAVGEQGVADLLSEIGSFPLANKPVGGKTSLAGVQDKIVLVRNADGWHRALDGYPSTHILKPVTSDFPSMIYDEEYGARFARALGLSAYETFIEEFAGVPALVIERYDRSEEVDGVPGRVHQEDFNQVLGARGDQKYQKYGGKVSLKRIAGEFRALGDSASLRKLATMTVLAAAIGNLDMHAKNISLLHHPDGSVELAPAYDVVPQRHLPNDGELALAVNGVYQHSALTRADLIAEIASWRLREAETLVDEALADIAEIVEDEVPAHGAHPGLVEDIRAFTVNLRSGRSVGAELSRSQGGA